VLERRAIWFPSLLSFANVVLTDATLRTGDKIEMKLGIIEEPFS
jgi:hypothetical protein